MRVRHLSRTALAQSYTGGGAAKSQSLRQSADPRINPPPHLPGLDIEVMHRRSADAEQIAVRLQAMPSFEAFGRALESANPFAFWADAARLLWLPWLALNPWLGVGQAVLAPGAVEEAPPTSPEQ
jgi:hypothetical protein